MEHYLKKLEDQVHNRAFSPALGDFEGATYTYADLAVKMAVLHAFFREAGIQKGDKISLVARNSARWAPQWVAIYTSSRAEKKTESRLRNAGFETFLPMQHKLHQWSDRWKSVEVPLITSYLFVKIRARDVIPLRSTPGVSYIVSWHREVAVIPQKEIDAIHRLVDADTELYVMSTQLTKGSQVRIIGGQFEGMEGTLISNCEEGNFCINISGLNVALITTVEQALIQPIEDSSKSNKSIWE